MRQYSVGGEIDLLIIGSGPIGATFARIVAEQRPEARIVMVDAGPQLTERPGVHVRNIADPAERTQAQIRSQGPTQFQYEVPPMNRRVAAAEKRGRERISFLSRPGTFLVNPDDNDLDNNDMPAAAAATNVGGAGAHWTCACPRPGNGERIPFISDDEWGRLCTRAEALLHVTQQAFPQTVENFAIQQVLGELYDPILPEGLKVQPMPLAVEVQAGGRLYWTGPDVILGKLAGQVNDGSGRFQLRSETICRRLMVEDGRVTGAELEHLPSGRRETVTAKFVAVGLTRCGRRNCFGLLAFGRGRWAIT